MNAFAYATIISQFFIFFNRLTWQLFSRKSIHLEIPYYKPPILQCARCCWSPYLKVKLSIRFCTFRKYVLMLMKIDS